MNKEEIIKDLLAFLTIILITMLILTWFNYKMDGSQEILERCQNAGYDGIKFENSYSNNLICSDFSIEEKIAKGLLMEKEK